MVVATFILRLGMQEQAGQYGFILFVPAIVAASLIFDRASGFVAVLLSIALISFVIPWDPMRSAQHLPGLLAFAVVGLGLVFVSEGLHKALARAYQAEREKDVLLQEMSHRVKNKFAMINSIIGLQSRGASPETEVALNAVAGRVRVIGDVHTYLQISRGDGLVDMPEYLGGLCRSLSDAVGQLRPITLAIKIDPIKLDARRALSVGLIVNELVTNAFKHAFPGERPGAVHVQLNAEADMLALCVSDDGIGCDENAQSNLGSRLVSVLAAQLGGEAKRQTGSPGYRTAVTFPRAAL
jgi:two-component sensor histidine kinase